jgi:hypothetical protein
MRAAGVAHEKTGQQELRPPARLESLVILYRPGAALSTLPQIIRNDSKRLVDVTDPLRAGPHDTLALSAVRVFPPLTRIPMNDAAIPFIANRRSVRFSRLESRLRHPRDDDVYVGVVIATEALFCANDMC